MDEACARVIGHVVAPGRRAALVIDLLHREGEESRCRAAVCDVCRGYVKMLSTLSLLPPLSLLVAVWWALR